MDPMFFGATFAVFGKGYLCQLLYLTRAILISTFYVKPQGYIWPNPHKHLRYRAMQQYMLQRSPF